MPNWRVAWFRKRQPEGGQRGSQRPGNKWARDGGIYLGLNTDRSQNGRRSPPAYNDKDVLTYIGDRHCVLVGGNGSGKTRRLLLTNALRLKSWSTVFIDTKGVVATITKGRMNTRRIVLDPFCLLGDEGIQFNPIAALDPDSPDFVDDAMLMAETIITIEGKEPHFSTSAQDFVCGFILYVRLKYGREGSLNDVRRLITLNRALMVGIKPNKKAKTDGPQLMLLPEPEPEPDQQVAGVVPDMLAIADKYDCPALAAKVTRLLDWTPDNREIQGVMATAIAQTRWMDSPRITACTSGDNVIDGKVFDFASLKDEPTSVFLVLPPARLSTHAMWTRLTLASILRPLMRDTRADSVPVLMMLDEFYAIAKGGLPIIDNNMAMFREYGIKLWIVLQDLAQAHMLYGQYGWQSYIANSGVFQSFATNDALTAKFVSDLSGEFFLDVKGSSGSYQYSPSGQMSETTASSVSKQRMPVILPQQARTMGDGYTVVFMNGEAHRYAYLPYPTLIPWTAEAMSADPSA